MNFKQFKNQIIEDLQTGKITPQTQLENITCRHCGKHLQPHTIEQHFDDVFMSHFHKCKDKESAIEWSEDNQHDLDSCPTIADDPDSKYYDFGKPKKQSRESLKNIIVSYQNDIVDALVQKSVNWFKYEFESITGEKELTLLLSIHNRLVNCKEFQQERKREREVSESHGFASDILTPEQMRDRADDEFKAWKQRNQHRYL